MPILRRREDFSRHLLEDLGRALHVELPDFDQWFDTVNLELTSVLRFDEDELAGEPDEKLPPWQRDAFVQAREIAADTTGRYVEVPSWGQQPRLGDFVRSIRDPELREQVRDAMHGGRGGYRRVKDLLHERGQLDLWHRFEEEQQVEAALAWLRKVGVVEHE